MFVADVTGTYVARLTVADDRGAEVRDTVKIVAGTIANVPPTADAGPNQRANVGQAVTLQGDGDDADGDSLDFDWSFDARPVGSTA